MAIHDEYIKLIEERYSDMQNESYETHGDYLTAIYAPHHYGTEEAMLNYIKANKKASLKDVVNYFDKITPEGLAPGDDGADLLEDDEE